MSKVVLNVKYLLLLSCLTAAKFYNLWRIQDIIGDVLTQKRSSLVICPTFRSDFYVGWKNQNKHSALNSSFDALSKWHEPDFNFFLILGIIWSAKPLQDVLPMLNCAMGCLIVLMLLMRTLPFVMNWSITKKLLCSRANVKPKIRYIYFFEL